MSTDYVIDGNYQYDGWVDDPDAVRVAVAEMGCPDVSDTAICEIPVSELPKEVNLYQFCQGVTGKPYLDVRNQGSVGSCVGHGTARGIEGSYIVECHLGLQTEEFKLLSRPVIYGGSRVDVNGGRSPFRSDGSVGAWAAKFVSMFGVIDEAKYGKYDLSRYSEDMCRQMGSAGVPRELLDVCKSHLVAKAAIVTTADDAQKALASGYGIAVCSNQGFSKRRDANGVCSPSGSWAHCMAIVGYRLINGKLYFVIENSWAAWNTGPKPEGYNDGCFLASADVVHRMLAMKDSFAFSGVEGWKRRVDDIDWSF